MSQASDVRLPAAAAATSTPLPQPARRNAHPPLVRQLPRERIWPPAAVVACQVGIVAAVIAGWELAATYRLIDPFFWSQPSSVVRTFRTFVVEGSAVTDTLFTFRSAMLSFVLGTISGSLLGLSFWWSRNYASVVIPFLICFEGIPKLALAPLIILVFGVGLASKIAIGVALTLIISALTTYAGVRAIDPDGEKLFYSLGATRRQVFTKLVFPGCLPSMISVLRINIGLALTGSVVGEFIASRGGLGRTILYAGETYDIALIWCAVGILSALSILLYVAVTQVEKWLMRGLAHVAPTDA